MTLSSIILTHPLLDGVTEDPIKLTLPHLQTRTHILMVYIVEPTEYLLYEGRGLLFQVALFDEPHTIVDDDARITNESLNLLVPIHPNFIRLALMHTQVHNGATTELYKPFRDEAEAMGWLTAHSKVIAEKAGSLQMYQSVILEACFILRWNITSKSDHKRTALCFALEAVHDYLTPAIFDKLCKAMEY